MSVRIFPQWLIDDHPWLKDVAAVLTVLQDLWHQYQNVVILVGLVLVARKLQKERLLLTEQIDTLGQVVKATRDEAEAAPAQQAANTAQASTAETEAAGSALANWETIRVTWRDARERLELAIQSIKRANVRRKYSKLSRSSYQALISALEKDLEWGPKIGNNLRQMDTMFHRLKFHPDRVSAADVAVFKWLYDVPDAELPKLPDEQVEEDAAVGAPQPA